MYDKICERQIDLDKPEYVNARRKTCDNNESYQRTYFVYCREHMYNIKIHRMYITERYLIFWISINNL